MTLPEMLAKIEKAPHIDFGDIFSRSFDLFQKVWLQALLLQVLNMAISWGVSMVIMLPMSLAGAFIEGSEVSYSDDEVGVAAIALMLLMYLIIIVIMSVVNFALQAALYRIIRMKDRNRSGDPGIGFGMFIKKQHIKKVVVLAMAQAGIAVLAMLFFIIPVFYVLVPLQFAIIIFAFNPDWSVNDIYKAAFRIGTKKWGVTFATVLILGVLAMIVGLMACFIGVYATLGIVYLPAYFIYKEVIGFTEDEDIISQIGA